MDRTPEQNSHKHPLNQSQDHEVAVRGDRRRFLAALAATVSLTPLLMCSRPTTTGGRTVPARPPSRHTGSQQILADHTEQVATRVLERPLPPSSEPVMRVRIDRIGGMRGQNAPQTVSAPDGWLIVKSADVESAGGPPGGHRGLSMRAPLKVALRSDGWYVEDAEGYRPPLVPARPVDISTPRGQRAEVRWNDRRYPGHLRLWQRTDEHPGGFDVVSHVPMEDYLPGVLEGELYRHWSPETFAAQAIAARSFACFEHLYAAGARSRHFDVTDTVASQVYVGGNAHQRAVEAVRRTRGIVLLYDDRLVPAYYSSCCGGPPARAIDAVSSNPINDIPPLNGLGHCYACSGFQIFNWTVRRSMDDVLTRLSAFGRSNSTAALRESARESARGGAVAGLPDGGHNVLADLRSLRNIEPAMMNRHGRPVRYALHCAVEDQVVMPAEALRRALSYRNNDLEPPTRQLRSSLFRTTVNGSTVTFTGRGFGHGVGMCQHGAEGMARSYQNAYTILEWYYPEAEIVRVYG